MSSMTTNLASGLAIGRRRAANRIAVLPVECNDGDAVGAPTERTLQRYQDFAAGGAGVIFVESLAISADSRSRVNQLQITELSASGLSRLVKAMREANPQALVLFQLSHSGRLCDPRFARPVAVYPAEGEGIPVLTAEQIEEAGVQFVQAAILAREVGADGIDFKQAHGILTAEMLRPANQRPDRYGGSFVGRTRFFRETVRQIRRGVDDPSFIVGARYSVYEGIPGGFGTAGPGEVAETWGRPSPSPR
jgi:2,4-dienoyl-CoA reductase-like NADH-dependent reductase (Old Yellow Enzyme family)